MNDYKKGWVAFFTKRAMPIAHEGDQTNYSVEFQSGWIAARNLHRTVADKMF